MGCHYQTAQVLGISGEEEEEILWEPEFVVTPKKQHHPKRKGATHIWTHKTVTALTRPAEVQTKQKVRKMGVGGGVDGEVPSPNQEDICNWYLVQKGKISYCQRSVTVCINHSPGQAMHRNSWPTQNRFHSFVMFVLFLFCFVLLGFFWFDFHFLFFFSFLREKKRMKLGG